MKSYQILTTHTVIARTIKRLPERKGYFTHNSGEIYSTVGVRNCLFILDTYGLVAT